MCAALQPDGDPCRRDATLAVIGGDLITLLCESDGWRIARKLGDVEVRELSGRQVWHLTSGRGERQTS